MTSSAPARRVVDAYGQGWSRTEGGLYLADNGPDRRLHGVRYRQLRLQRGPLRPVLPITDDDRQVLRDALAAARQLAVTTLAAAVADATARLVEIPAPRHVLVSGDENSCDSRMLISLGQWGADLHPERLDECSRAVLGTMLCDWAIRPDRYTEVAGTLTMALSHVADHPGPLPENQAFEPDAWRRVADSSLQPGGVDSATGQARVAYLYLMAHSDQFSTTFASEELLPVASR